MFKTDDTLLHYRISILHQLRSDLSACSEAESQTTGTLTKRMSATARLTSSISARRLGLPLVFRCEFKTFWSVPASFSGFALVSLVGVEPVFSAKVSKRIAVAVHCCDSFV